MIVLRSNSALSRSTAILSLPSVTSPRRLIGRSSLCAASPPAFEPGRQHLRIAGLDLGRAGEGDAVAADREMAAQAHLREAGRAKFEAVEIPAVGVGADVAAQILRRVLPPSVTWSMPMPIWIGIGGTEGAAGQLREFADAPPPAAAGRRRSPASARSRSICRPDSTPSKRGCLPNLKSATPVSLKPLLLRAVLEFDLLHQRRRRVGLDLAARRARAGVNARRRCASAMPTGRVRLKRAVELRLAVGERQHAVGFDAERMIDRIDIEMKLERAVVDQRPAASRNG